MRAAQKEADVRREPIFRTPTVIIVVLGLLGFIHAARALVFSPDDDQLFLWTFAFIPARYQDGALLTGGWGAKIWTFVSYALIHADFSHLAFNALWLLVFGSAVARRFGASRFLLLFVATAAAGALTHLGAHAGDVVPMIGASASISGTMGAAARFAFQRGGPLDLRHGEAGRSYHVPAAPLRAALHNPQVLAFLAVWFGLNLLFGLGSWSIVGEEQSVAWEAHVGGFLVGLLLFRFFDPVRPQNPADDHEAAPFAQ